MQDIKLLLRETRNYFAGNVTGITRDETIAEYVIRFLFCKLYSEHNLESASVFNPNNFHDEDQFYELLNNLFEEVKQRYSGIFDATEKLDLPLNALSFLVENFGKLHLSSMGRDVIGDAFEELIGTSFRGGEGQFFTPRNVVEHMIEVLDPQPGEKLIDPACGSGGFLAHAIRHLGEREIKPGTIVGIDKDNFLAKIARTYTSILVGTENTVFSENSLAAPDTWSKSSSEAAGLGTFDLVITNPPFGAKIPVTGRALLSQYELANNRDGKSLRDKQAPQILFIERCVQLLRPGGRMGIVLPEGVFGNPSDKYVWEYLERVGEIFGVVSLPQETFQPSTHTKTSILYFRKAQSGVNGKIFMSTPRTIGHNKNGKATFRLDVSGEPILDNEGLPTSDDDLPKTTRDFIEFKERGTEKFSDFSFAMPLREIHDQIYIPDFYNPEVRRELQALKNSSEYKVRTIRELVVDGHLEISRGKEIGSHCYGTGDIPFVRTSDIVNWEIKFDPVKSVSKEVYEKYRKTQDVRPGDIFLVNDGTFLIGRTAIVQENDGPMLYQSHLRKLRALPDAAIDSFYLFYLLNTKLVQDQISALTFVQATISTIGDRLLDVQLPISAKHNERIEKSAKVREIINAKSEIRQLTKQLLE